MHQKQNSRRHDSRDPLEIGGQFGCRLVWTATDPTVKRCTSLPLTTAVLHLQ